MTKAILAIAIMLCSYLITDAQTLRMDQVPKDAQHTFRTRYPAAQQESWERVAKDTYQVGFFNGKKRQTARYDAAGTWIETETEISFSQVPRGVSAAVAKQFAGYDVQQAALIEGPDHEEPTYEIILFKGKENYDVVFSAKGEVLKKEAGE
jgi:hypothetical protein